MENCVFLTKAAILFMNPGDLIEWIKENGYEMCEGDAPLMGSVPFSAF